MRTPILLTPERARRCVSLACGHRTEGWGFEPRWPHVRRAAACRVRPRGYRARVDTTGRACTPCRRPGVRGPGRCTFSRLDDFSSRWVLRLGLGRLHSRCLHGVFPRRYPYRSRSKQIVGARYVTTENKYSPPRDKLVHIFARVARDFFSCYIYSRA